jgi:hypothetical protein
MFLFEMGRKIGFYAFIVGRGKGLRLRGLQAAI